MELKMKTESHSAASEEVHSAGGDGNPGKVSQPEQVTAPLSVSSEYAFLAPGSLYVDKTLMVKELMDEYPDKGVLLLARPHGFGKTFLLKTLKAFFERPGTASDVPASMDTSLLFQNRKIWACGEEYRREQGKYPVLYLSFRDAKASTWGELSRIILGILQEEARRHPELEHSEKCSRLDVEYYKKLKDGKLAPDQMACALKILSRMLDMHYEAPSVVLIDDYDVPLQQACLHHYCQDLKKHYVRSFSIGLQGNTHMHYGILTGVLWVKMGNMLTGGFDHLLPDTVLDEEFGTSFGFTGEEVRDLARLCGEEGRYPELREWYGGHCIGGTEIFNPQSVMKYFASGCQARPYWTDAVDTGMLTELLERTSGDTEKRLIRIQNWKPGHEPVQGYFYFNLGMNLTEDRKYVRTDLFSFLIAEGLLRADNVQYGRGLCVPADLAVPNRETQEPFHKEVISRLAQRNLSSSVGVLEG